MQTGGVQQIVPPAVTRRSSMRVFVGRVNELADLASALDEAASGRGSLVLVTGEPGIGKTRLMSELGRVGRQRRGARRRGSLLGGARRSAVLALDAGHPHAGRRSRGAGRARRLEGGGLALHAAAAVMPEGERLRLFDFGGPLPRPRPASERPILVVLDDLHAWDESSLVLLRFLADVLAEARILVVASYREAERRVRELSDVFAELARVGRRIPLRGLTPADIEAYVATVTGIDGEPPDHRAAVRAHGRQSLLPWRGRSAADGGPHP